MRPKNIYLRSEELEDNYMCERMVSCDVAIGSCNAEYTDLSQVWHDVSEEPKKGELILVEVVNTIPESKDIRYFVEYAAEWVLNYIKTEGFKCRWAYISDLLPKGGEE